jgi:hypothetical protein
VLSPKKNAYIKDQKENTLHKYAYQIFNMALTIDIIEIIKEKAIHYRLKPDYKKTPSPTIAMFS